MNLKQIKEFFKDFEFPEEVIVLDKCATVTDIKKMVYSHIATLEANPRSDRHDKPDLWCWTKYRSLTWH